MARWLAALFNPHLYPKLESQLQIPQQEIGCLSGTSRKLVIWRCGD